MSRMQVQPSTIHAGSRAALIVAHPGHELALAGWLAMSQPTVFVITDGSGQLSRPRLHSTTKVLLRAGARPGSIYGHLSDTEAYAAMLGRDVDLFLRMAIELADWMWLDGVDYVVGDSAEGYNPTHDLCRVVIGGAVALASRLRERPIGNYEYVVTGPRTDCMAGRCGGTIKLELNDAALATKIEAARGYPELAGEVESAIRRDGVESFRHECFHPVGSRATWTPEGHGRPFYEEHGRSKVATGKYHRTVGYAEHIAPLQTAFWGALRRTLDSRVETGAVGTATR